MSCANLQLKQKRVSTIGYILISVKTLLTYGKFNRLLESSLRELHFGKFCADFHSLVFHHHSYYIIFTSLTTVTSYQLFHWYSHCYHLSYWCSHCVTRLISRLYCLISVTKNHKHMEIIESSRKVT